MAESSQLPLRARMKVHNSVTSLRSPPQTERPLARSTMLSVSATFMTKVVLLLSVSQYASRTSASASLVKPVVWVDLGRPISLVPMCSPVAFSGEHTCS